MTLKAVIQSDVVDVLLNTDDFAESVTYTPVGGVASTFSAIVTHEPLVMGSWTDGEGELHRAMVFVDDANVAAPARGDSISITVGGTAYTYKVDTWAGTLGGWRLASTRISEQELAGDGHRIRRQG